MRRGIRLGLGLGMRFGMRLWMRMRIGRNGMRLGDETRLPIWDDTWHAARRASQDAVSAVSVRHLISQNGFMLEHYNIQTKPWRDVIGEFEE